MFLRWAFAAISAVESVIPLANFAIVFPVHGAITTTSNKAFGPIGSASGIEYIPFCPVNSSISLIKSFALLNLLSIDCTFSEKTGTTFMPLSFNDCITAIIFLNVQNEPVITNPTVILLYNFSSILHFQPPSKTIINFHK